MSFIKRFFPDRHIISESAESLKDLPANVLEVDSSGLSGLVLYPAHVDCHSFLLTGLLQLRRYVILQIRKYSSFLKFWNAAFAALAFHDFSSSPCALSFHPPLHPLFYTFLSVLHNAFFSSTIRLFFLPPFIVLSCSSSVPLIRSLPASSALSFYCHDN